MRHKKNSEKSASLDWKLLSGFLKGSLSLFLLCIAFSLLQVLFEMLLPQILRYTVDCILGSEPSFLPDLGEQLVARLGGRDALRDRLWIPAAAALSVGLLSAAARYYTNLYNAKAGETLVKHLRDRLYRHILRLPWSWHQKNATGDIIQRCTSDVDMIQRFFQDQFVMLFRVAVLLVLSLSCMFSMSTQLSLVALAFIPIVFAYSLIFHNKIHDRFLVCDENEGVLSTIVQENLTGVRVVRAFGRESFERDRFEAQNEKYTGLWVHVMKLLNAFWALGDVVSSLQVMLIIVIGSVLCVRGSLTGGEFIAFVSYNAMLIWPIRMLGRMVSEMSKVGVSLDRLAYILNSEEEQDLPEASEPELTGDICFEDVTFRYAEDSPPALSGVSFTVPAHTSFGILGGTGSGKSSLMHLLCRLYAPDEGRITIGGTDIAAIKAGYLRDRIGLVLQEPFLFSRSIEENIGITGAGAEDIREAARIAAIHEDIESFSQGYATPVGERGVTLSGGQKQRVAMARTLTKKAPIVIFDDSLSAVDTETDERIRRALAEKMQGVTNIIISHRITTLMDCDRILVLDKGRVAELGSPRELYEKGGIYRRIYDLQMSLGEEEDNG